jgi:MbtH protein
MLDEQEEQTIYKVVVNHEEQPSFWPANKANALGRNDAGGHKG